MTIITKKPFNYAQHSFVRSLTSIVSLFYKKINNNIKRLKIFSNLEINIVILFIISNIDC